MTEMEPVTAGSPSSKWRNILLVVAAVYVCASLFFLYNMNQRLDSIEQKQVAAEEKLGKKIASTESAMHDSSAQMERRVGETQKQFAARAAELQRQQKLAETRLKEEQDKQQQALGAVSGDVAGVKTDVGGVKTDVAATKTELEATKAKLERAIGDLGIQSGLIATTREDLEYLKHKGDRNYYDFTLQKSKSSTPVGTVSLQLKKVDVKKGKYTLAVAADDKVIEKKDKNVNEPVQFYSGRDHLLYEVVVFEAAKNQVTGYLSTPKTAPTPAKLDR